MSLPFFYLTEADAQSSTLEVGEDQARHMVQVLRMKSKDRCMLTNGRGLALTAELESVSKSKVRVNVLERHTHPAPARRISIGISLLKNPSRLEWFLEKATELGVGEITLLACERTEKLRVRADRLEAILISAMLQSQQCWLPLLRGPLALESLLRECRDQQRFIAYCGADLPLLNDLVNPNLSSQTVLIGPEGDFSEKEIEQATSAHFLPVSLGATRLRTETAGLVAATLLTLC